MMLLTRAITQKFSTPTNNRLRTSSNTRNQAVINDGTVDIQTKNAGYGRNGNKNAGRQNRNQAANAGNDETLEELTSAVIMMVQIQPADDNAETKPKNDVEAVGEVNALHIDLISSMISKGVHEHTNHEKLKTVINTSDDDQIDCNIIFDDPYKNGILMLEKGKISSDSKDIQANLLKRIQILENDFKRSQAQSIDFKLKQQYQKEKMACDNSWKLKLTKLSDENCNGELKWGKAKVAWDIICLPKREGGLGIRSLETFNIALMTTHTWNFVTNRDSLWVWWVHMHKLKGRTIWDIPVKADMSWGWRKLLQIRAWEALRPRGNEITWYHIVWFSHNIPRHAFNLWLIMRRSLKTQDRLRQWDVGPHVDLNTLRCKLCDSQPDSHEHLFFECPYSARIWILIRSLGGMELVSPKLHDIISYLQPIAHRRNARSVIGRILVAAAAYFIWVERNNRVFKNSRRSPKELRDAIIVTVRLKLLSFRFKNTAAVQDILARWKMPSSFYSLQLNSYFF
ncbi:homeodomain-like protein [Tanacetum coccineum]